MQEIQLHFDTFTVLVVSFAPPATTLRIGCLASWGQVGLCRGLAPSLKSLCDGGGINGIRHAAEAFLWHPVKFLRSGVAVGESGGGGGRLLGLSFRLVMLDGVVCVRAFKPGSRPTGDTMENKYMNNNVYTNKYKCLFRQKWWTYPLSVVVLRGERCSGGGKLMYSVLIEVLGSNCCFWWSGVAWPAAPWGNSPMGAGKIGYKLKPAEWKKEKMLN